MKKKEKLPSKLFRNYFAIRLPDINEDEQGLQNTDEDNGEGKTIVAQISDECVNIKVGDEVMIPAGTAPRGGFNLEEGDYLIFAETDLLGVW